MPSKPALKLERIAMVVCELAEVWYERYARAGAEAQGNLRHPCRRQRSAGAEARARPLVTETCRSKRSPELIALMIYLLSVRLLACFTADFMRRCRLAPQISRNLKWWHDAAPAVPINVGPVGECQSSQCRV